MSLTELFPAIKMLPRADKLRLMQFLVIDLAQEEGIPLLSAEAEYPIWTPLNAFDAADTLWQMLQTHQADTMTTPVRFAYADAPAGRTEGSRLAYLPITLRHATHVLAVVGLLDTGSTVNVLPYPFGLQLGFVWEQQTTRKCN